MNNQKPFSKVRKRDILLIVFILILVASATYIWTNHHLQVRRAAYVLQKPFVDVRCSTDAPPFMAELMRYTIDTQASMNNQLAYYTPDGKLHHCSLASVLPTHPAPP